jgi:hypothetical protein
MITVGDAATVTNLDEKKISQWIHAGILHPEHAVPNGSGDRAILGDRNVAELRMIDRLMGLGLKRSTVKSIVQTVSHSKIDWASKKGWIIIDENEEWFFTDNLKSILSIKNVGSLLVLKL